MKMQKDWQKRYRNWRLWVFLPVIIPLLILGAVGQTAYKALTYIGEAICRIGYWMERIDTTPKWVDSMIEWIEENNK